MNDMLYVATITLPLALVCAGLFLAAYWAPAWLPKVAMPVMRVMFSVLEFIGRLWEARMRPGRW